MSMTFADDIQVDTKNNDIEERSLNIPRVPGYGDNDNARDSFDERREYYDERDMNDVRDTGFDDRFRDPYNDGYNDINDFQADINGPCQLLVDRLKQELRRDRSTLTLLDDNSGRFESAGPVKVSGFNSFSVKDCDPVVRGVLMLKLEFNEISFYMGNRGDSDTRYYQGRPYDDRYDRYDHYDRYSRRYDDRYGDRYRGYGQHDRHGGHMDLVQVYGLGLEYGYVSDRMTGAQVPLTGVRITMDNVKYRINADTEEVNKVSDSAGENLVMSYKRDLEQTFESIFQKIIREFKGDSERYKREARFDPNDETYVNQYRSLGGLRRKQSRPSQ